MKSLQETYAPKSICFGCGPANTKGLRIRSFFEKTDAGEITTCKFRPEKHHEAFPGMVNGGIIGALLDCHSNWTAAHHLMRTQSLESPPCTVTADFHVKLRRPTPSNAELELKAKVAETQADRAVIEAELWAEGKLCATCRGTFIAVKEGHPAYHRWG
jgi:acyl-coenzyme A thioesterase PaaI-like protein